MTTARGGLRDRLFLAVFFLGVLLVLGVQFLAGLSMRQPLQTTVSYSLTAINLIGLLLTLFLGVNLLSTEIQSHSIFTILAQPVRRSVYIFGKFCGVSALLFLAVLILSCCASLAIALIINQNLDFGTISLMSLIWAFFSQFLSFSLLAAVTILFSTVATSTVLPFLLSSVIYIIGLATAPARAFLATPTGQELYSPFVRHLVDIIYYILPNFSFFNQNQQLIYNLPLPWQIMTGYVCYYLLYTSILLYIATLILNRRNIK